MLHGKSKINFSEGMSEVSSQTPCNSVNTNLLVEKMNNAIVHLVSRGTAIRKYCSINNEWHVFQKKTHAAVISSLYHFGNERPLVTVSTSQWAFSCILKVNALRTCLFQYIIAGMLLQRKKLEGFLQSIILLNHKYCIPGRLTSIQ